MPVLSRDDDKNEKLESEAPAAVEENDKAAPREAGTAESGTDEAPVYEPSKLEKLIHETCDSVGNRVIGEFKRTGYALRRIWNSLRTNIPPAFRQWKRKAARRIHKFSDDLLFPYRIIAKETRDLWRRLRDRRKKQEDALPAKESLRLYVRATERPFNRIANFFAPIIGVAILATAVGIFSKVAFAVKVDYNGETLGYIENEQKFYEARNTMLDLLINEEYIPPEDTIPSLSIAIVNKKELLTEDELVRAIMESSGNELKSASGFYLDGKFLGAVENSKEFLLYIDQILNSYRTGEEHEVVQFTKNIALKDGVYPKSSILSLSTLQDYLRSNERLERTYVAEEGDTINTIAKRYSTTAEELFRLNWDIKEYLTDLRIDFLGYDPDAPLLEEEEEEPEETAKDKKDSKADKDDKAKQEEKDSEEKAEEEKEPEPPPEPLPTIELADVPLTGGEEILVSRIHVSLGIQVTRRETYIGKVPYGTTYIEDNKHPVDYKTVVSYGIPGTEEVLADITYVDGVQVSESVISRKPLSEPVNQRVKVGTLSLSEWLDGTGGNFIWPVDGGRFNGSLGSYRGHTGMDIAAPIGTNVRASKPGYVTQARNGGWNYGYGRTIVIDHGDGVITRYAHLSRVNVYAGQYVEKGQIIGAVGVTGNTTGPHLHFEIRIGGQIMAPEKFSGY